MAADTDGIQYMMDKFRDVPDGYLIDVGAHDGVAKGSMSRDLVVRGWGGLMIEPLPEAFSLLSTAYRDHPKVHCVQVICSDEGGVADLYPCKGVSTVDPAWAKACSDWWSHVKYGPPIQIKKRKLSTILNQYDVPRHIHLLQIDTEGHDLHVLRGMDWDRTVDMVCVETLDMLSPERRINGIWQPRPEMHAYLKSLRYRLDLLTSGGNGFYLREGFSG